MAFPKLAFAAATGIAITAVYLTSGSGPDAAAADRWSVGGEERVAVAAVSGAPASKRGAGTTASDDRSTTAPDDSAAKSPRTWSGWAWSWGEEAVAGAYFLSGEVAESGYILGVHGMRALGFAEREGAQRTAPDTELQAEAWLKAGTQDEKRPATAAPRPALAVEPTTGGSRVVPAEALNRSSADGVTPVAATTGTPVEEEAEPTLATCAWPELEISVEAMGNDALTVMTEMGLMSESARRLPDGSVFMPKVTQRLLGIRTADACEGVVASTRRLVGHVIANPTSSGLVQAEQDGRIEMGPFGFPVIGQEVRAGELLGYLRPTLSTPDRAALNAQIQTLRGDVAAKELEIARTREMPLLPFREGRLLSLRLELNRLKAERDALIEGVEGREPLVASTSGMIVRSEVRVGQVVEARQILFEIADPEDLWVEAEMFGGEPLRVSQGSTAVTSDGRVYELEFQGAGLATSEAQASPVQFRLMNMDDEVRIGERVVVNMRERANRAGILVPRSAAIRQTNGETVLWRSVGPERFERVRMNWEAVDGNTVLIETGLTQGESVVVKGATLMSEIR